MRNSCIVLMLVMATVAFAADAPKPLKDTDRLLIRDAQLALAQAHIARLQAESQVVAGEARISQIVQTLKTQYACPDCTLSNDFTWTPAPPAAVDTTPSSVTTPTPTKKGGTIQKKE
jgi:hypothetical protein